MSETSGAGRPSLYNSDVCDLICELLASGKSLNKICADPSMPSKTTVLRWTVDKTKKEFWYQYEQAKMVRNYVLADELIDLSDPDELDTLLKVSRNRLQIDTRKWWLSKVMPKEYGDKVEAVDAQDTNAPDLSKLTLEERVQWLEMKRKMNGQ